MSGSKSVAAEGKQRAVQDDKVMGCQKKIAEKIIEKKADYLFFLKGNQEKIHEDVRLAAKAMRAHWSIENNLHWVLDTVFDEDYCRVRKDIQC